MTQSPCTRPAAADIQPLPAPPAERDPPDASLVPVRSRADGWTAEKQHAFIAHLEQYGSVKAACAAVGMSEHSAYRLRRRADAAAFRDAWAEAVRINVERVAESVIDRALNGDLRQRWFKGELVGEERVYSDRLQTWLITNGMAVLDRLDAARAADAGLPVIAPVAQTPAAPLRVWQDEHYPILRTNAAMPRGYDPRELEARGSYGDPDFSRLCTITETRNWKARTDVKAANATAEQARRALFNRKAA